MSLILGSASAGSSAVITDRTRVRVRECASADAVSTAYTARGLSPAARLHPPLTVHDTPRRERTSGASWTLTVT